MVSRFFAATFRAPALTVGALLGTYALPATAAAQADELFGLQPSNVASNDENGRCVALEGDVAVVGAPSADGLGSQSGQATVFRFDGSTWQEEQILLASDGLAQDRFGTAIALRGDLLLIGAPGVDDMGSASGAAYVFRFNGSSWEEEQKLTGGDSSDGDEFGAAVAIEGDLAAIGAPDWDGVNSDEGAVYAFEYKNAFVGWSESQKLSASNAENSLLFGRALSMRDGWLAIGAPGRRISGVQHGAVFLYSEASATWTLEDELFPQTPLQNQSFGSAVSVDYPSLLVGAPKTDESSALYDTGAAYFLESNGSTWDEQMVVRSNQVVLANFGSAVSLDGDAAVIGAYAHDLKGNDSGVADSLVRVQGIWLFDQELGATSLSSTDNFGWSVAVSGNRALIGSPRDNGATASDGGIAFVHSVNELLLEVDDLTPAKDDPINFSSVNGTPGTKCFFTVDSVNGSPFFQILFFANFASNHEFAFGTNTPDGLAGASITFRTYRITAWGKAIPSNPVTVDFQ